jgi:selenide,water dikinase
MGPGDLQDVLGGLRQEEHADLLVGLGRSDDAAVYRITDDVAIVETVDFFPPIVDDPYLYGAIAAVNSMSDVYAMGGQVLFALNVAGFPRDLPKEIIAAVFRGGADKVREAGGVVAGGHTVVDAEPKYGLCVTGRVDPRRVLLKGGLRPGQRVFLSKPLGTGVIATAAKSDACDPAVLEGAVQSMLRLNRVDGPQPAAPGGGLRGPRATADRARGAGGAGEAPLRVGDVGRPALRGRRGAGRRGAGRLCPARGAGVGDRPRDDGAGTDPTLGAGV